MRILLTIFLLLAGEFCFANMASPIREGTYSTSAFSSRDIDILEEKIFLKTDKDFRTIFYSIEYLIKADSAGSQIPLLFYAKDYKDDFKVWVDGREVLVLEIPKEYATTSNSPFEKFAGHFGKPVNAGEPETVVIYWEEHLGNIYNLSDLKYFEIDLTKGEHRIKVEYTADAWIDVSDWVKEYSFRYSLSPAENWRSFGKLEITLDASAFHRSVKTNLGEPASGKTEHIAAWKFSRLPAKYIEITYKPEIIGFAAILVTIGPIGLTIIFTLILGLFHYRNMKKYREKFPAKRFSWVWLGGSLLIPFVILFFFICSFGIIDSAIGSEAGSYHGYTFMIIVLYPFLLPVYLLIMLSVDTVIKKRLNGPQKTV